MIRATMFATGAVVMWAMAVAAQTTPPPAKADALWEAARKGDAAAVTVALDAGVDVNTPFRYGATALYVCLNNGTLAAYTVATGERLCQERLGGKGGAFSASPLAADGKIYLASEDGDVFVVKAGPAYELPATNPVGEVLMATPAITHGTLYIRGLKHLVAIREAGAL